MCEVAYEREDQHGGGVGNLDGKFTITTGCGPSLSTFYENTHTRKRLTVFVRHDPGHPYVIGDLDFRRPDIVQYRQNLRLFSQHYLVFHHQVGDSKRIEQICQHLVDGLIGKGCVYL